MWTRDRLAVLMRALLVAVITAITFLTFFSRDYLLMRFDHTGYALDVFYTGMVVPALVVNIFLIPFGTALIPHFARQQADQRDSYAFPEVSRVALWLSMTLAGVALFLFAAFNSYSGLIASGFDGTKLAEVHEVLAVGAMIMALGGTVIVLNAALNAAGHQTLTAVAQLSVAVIAIVVVLTLYRSLGVMSAVLGMLVGQFANLAILVLYLWSQRNRRGTGKSCVVCLPWRELAVQYLPLVGAAFLAGATLPVTNALAASLSPGSVALFGFGYKVILFVTGIVATALSTVVVPHFVRQFNVSAEHAGRDAIFFLWIITLATLPVVMATYGWADKVAATMLPGRFRMMGSNAEMARIIKFGIVQLPFFSVSVVLTQYLIACRRSTHVFFAAFISVTVLVVAGMLFKEKFGIAGIALATALSVAVMSLYLVLLLYRIGQLTAFHLVSTLVFWMLFVTLSVCMHYASYTGIIISLFAIVLLLVSNRDAILPWQQRPQA